MERGNGKSGDLRLLHAIESAMPAIPRAVFSAFPRHEIVNATWLMLKRRGIRHPTRLQVRCAAIDHLRSVTHYRKGKGYPEVLPESNVDGRELRLTLERQAGASNGEARATVVDHLLALKARAGLGGVCHFLLADVIGLDAEVVRQVLEA